MATVIGEFVAKIGADMKGFDKGVDRANTKMGKFASEFSKHRKAIGIGMTAMGGAIVGGLGLMVKSAVEFEAGMREVNTMMGLGQEEFQALSKDVLNLAKDLGVNAVDATGALYQAISAGVPKENVLTFLEVASRTAIGGVTDTETAVDGLTTVMNAFKIPIEDVQKVADVMFTTMAGGKTTIEELSAKLFNVAPFAAQAGISFEEVSAALAAITKQGTPTAVATTQLRQAIVGFQKPTAEMEKALLALGFASGRAMVGELGLAGALQQLEKFSKEAGVPIDELFSSVEGGAAVLALTGDNASDFATALDDMAHASDGAGASMAAFNEVEKGSARQLDKAKESIKAVAIEIGGNLLPQLIPLIKQMGEVVGKVSAWMEQNPQLVGTLVKIVAVIGALMLVLGPLMLILPGIISALPLLGAAFAVLAGPVGLIILAIIALVAAGVWLVKNWDEVKAATVRIWGSIVNFIEDAVNDVIGFINNLIRTINLIPGINIGMIGNVDFGMKKMHSGGRVPGRPGQEVPILAEAGEVITPAGAGEKVEIHNYLYIDGEQITEVVERRMDRHLRVQNVS